MGTVISPIILEKNIGTISESENGWTKEVNMSSWNGKPLKFDIRCECDPSHEGMSKGVTLTYEEARKLLEILKEHFREG